MVLQFLVKLNSNRILPVTLALSFLVRCILTASPNTPVFTAYSSVL